jgi:hypothetical protein
MSEGTPFDVLPPRPHRRRIRRRPLDQPPPTPGRPGALARALGWLLAPHLWILLGLAAAVALLLSLYNPVWGLRARAWPQVVALAFEGGRYVFGPDDARVWALLLAAAAWLAALGLRSGRVRGTLVLAGAAALLLGTASPASHPGDWILAVAFAATGGALLARRRGALLLTGAFVLAAWFFFPQAGLHPAAYTARGPDHVASLLDGVTCAEVRDGLASSVGLLLLAVGALSLVGLGGRWARWVGGLLLLGLWATHGVDAWLGAGGSAGWQEGLSAWARVAQAWPATWLLPAAVGFADLAR